MLIDFLNRDSLSFFERWLLFSVPDALLCQIFDAIHLADLHRLGRVSTSLYCLFMRYRATRWDIVNFLGLWSTHPTDFMRSLSISGGVISGSQALRFMDRENPSASSDLDIFMRVEGMASFGKMLSRGGYTIHVRDRHTVLLARGRGIEDLDSHISSLVKSRRFSRTLDMPSIICVYDCLKPLLGANGRTRCMLNVQLVLLNSDPIEFIVQDFHSSRFSIFLSLALPLTRIRT